MSSLTTRLRLKAHTLADRFKISDYAGNWDLLDDAPGIYICTHSTRPSDWTSDQTGREIYETDTSLGYRWTGSAWVRSQPRGEVTHVEVLTDYNNATLSYTPVLTTTTLDVRAYRHLITVEAPRVYNTNGLTGFAIYRDATLLQEWVHQGHTGAAAADQARPLSFTTTDLPSAGSATYILKAKAVTGYGGTSYVEADTNRPASLTVVEV